MTTTRILLALAALSLPMTSAQDIAPKDGDRDPLFPSFGGEFDHNGIPNVSLDFDSSIPSLVSEDPGTPVLVTGNSPFGEDGEILEEPSVPEPEGVTVKVEPGRDGQSSVAADAVKLLAPFPAKPLFQPPAGWHLEHPDSVPPFSREVSLSNGTRITLSIRPHLLVPDADGDQVVAVNEPGYDPELGYAQTGTMAAVLSTTIQRMEEDSIKMSEALDRMSQLLGSLPSADASPGQDESPEKE